MKHNNSYEPNEPYAITYADLVACGKFQGLDIRPASSGGDIQIGDILLWRDRELSKHVTAVPMNRTRSSVASFMRLILAMKEETKWPGLKQEESIMDWLHNCYFAAVGGDAASFARWPTEQKSHLHEYILALWRIPLGEMLDLEKLTKTGRTLNRWTFFTSSRANCPGEVSTHVNATAIF